MREAPADRRPDPIAQAPAPPRFGEALRFWLKLGFISFGGPAGQIAILHAEVVERRRWLSERRFLHALNYCMLLPGPEAQQLVTYLGWLLHRTRGGLVAGLLFVLPSLFILIALSALYWVFGERPVMAGVLWGIKPVVCALVLHAAWRIGKKVLRDTFSWALALGAWAALALLALPFPLIVALAAVLGWSAHRWGWRHEPARVPGSGAGVTAPQRPDRPRALFDDDDPVPAHARFNLPRLARVCALGVAAGLLPWLALLAWGAGAAPAGSPGVLAQMAQFFTQAALLTFGGAYAVLPYVHQGAVVQHGWLTAGQMMDGLALGETTPGPLIMVVAFVGFLGGAGSSELAALLPGASPLVLGALAAGVVTWFTFLPSFVFIFAGGPWVESTRQRPALSAPLAAITAAVVGVIVNLALVFGWQVLWPHGLGTGWARAADLPALALGAAAGAALVTGRLGVMGTVALGALAGLVFKGLAA